MFGEIELTYWSLLGAVGIAFIEISYLPQIIRLYRQKSAENISLFFPALNLLGRVCAFAYALNSSIEVFAIGFLVGIGLRGVLLFQVLYYRTIVGWLDQRRIRLNLPNAAVSTIVSGDPR